MYLKNGNSIYVLNNYDGVDKVETPEGNRFDLYRNGDVVEYFYSNAKSVNDLFYTPNLKKSLVLKFKNLKNQVKALEVENEMLKSTNDLLNNNLEVMNVHIENLSNQLNNMDLKYRNEKIHHDVTLAKTDSLERIITGWEAGKQVKSSTSGTNPNSPMQKTAESKYPNDSDRAWSRDIGLKKKSVKFNFMGREYILNTNSLDTIVHFLNLRPFITHFYADGQEITHFDQITGVLDVETDPFDITLDNHPFKVNYSTQFKYLGDVIFSNGRRVDPEMTIYDFNVSLCDQFNTGFWVNVEDIDTNTGYEQYAYDPLNPTFTDRVPVLNGRRLLVPVGGCNMEYEHSIVIDFEGERYETYQVTPSMLVKPFLESIGASGYLANGSTKLQTFGHYTHANYERGFLNITIQTSNGDVNLDVHPSDYVGTLDFGPLMYRNKPVNEKSTFESAGIHDGAVLKAETSKSKRYPTRSRKSKK